MRNLKRVVFLDSIRKSQERNPTSVGFFEAQVGFRGASGVWGVQVM